MKKILLLLGVMLLIQWSLQNNVDRVVDNLAKDRWMEVSFLGMFGEDNYYFTNVEKLRKRASRKKLLELLDHENGRVVAGAAQALIEREEVDPLWLFQKFFEDKRSFDTSLMCLLTTSTIPDRIYYTYLGLRTEYGREIGEDFSTDTFEQRERKISDSRTLWSMDQLILYSEPIDEILLHAALENRIYQGRNLDRIKYLAYEEHEFSAIEYLFKNHLEEEEVALKSILQELEGNLDLEYYEENSIQQMLSKWYPPKKPTIDSLYILSYEGGVLPPPPPPPPPPGLENVPSNGGKHIQEYYQNLYPNYDPARDMPLPPMTRLLMDSNNKYHPSIRWESKKVFTGKELKDLRTILTCEKEKTMESPSADCFNPRHGVIVFEGERIVEVYSICLECNRVQKIDLKKEASPYGSATGYNVELDCVDFSDLAESLVSHQFPKH